MKVLLLLIAVSAPAAAAPLPPFDGRGYVKLFDGETLAGWDGDPTYWSVKDGKLVGTVTPQTLLKKNSWIVCRRVAVADFELVLDYRVSAKGNSGVGYRLHTLAGDRRSVRGPQADIDGRLRYTGICYEENGRRLLAGRGQSTRIAPGKLPTLVKQFADAGKLRAKVNAGWNRYRLAVKGSHARHFLNGVLVSEVRDRDDANRMKAGRIGVQVHVGPPMTVAFRNIYLKHLGPAPDAGAAYEYKPGALLERDHAATFRHLMR